MDDVNDMSIEERVEKMENGLDIRLDMDWVEMIGNSALLSHNLEKVRIHADFR